MRKTISILLIGFSLLACGILEGGLPEPDGKWHCGPLPETFQESDLIGTWESTGIDGVEEIILREDGTYKQIVQHYNYESNWNQWWVEHRPNGGVYLHLDKMRFNRGPEEEFERPEGGIGHAFLWDPCEYRTFEAPQGKIILAVARDNLYSRRGIAPRGVILVQMKMSDGANNGWFTRQE